jgi:DsbC/DsbD-like thiol-disulfide interchange protein
VRGTKKDDTFFRRLVSAGEVGGSPDQGEPPALGCAVSCSLRAGRTGRSLAIRPLVLACVVAPLGGTGALAAKPDVQAVLTAPVSCAAGSTVPLRVELRIGRGWHVNSHTPKESFLIPTDLNLKPSAGTLSEVGYPPHVEKSFEFSDGPVAVYEGTVLLLTDLEVPEAATGTITVTGTLSYQACDEHACYPPASISLQSTISVSPPPGEKRQAW